MDSYIMDATPGMAAALGSSTLWAAKLQVGGWHDVDAEPLRATLDAVGGVCDDALLAAATRLVTACLARCGWTGGAFDGLERDGGDGGAGDAGDAASLGDQAAADACSRLSEVCVLAAATCQSLATACGASPQQQQQQQPAPRPPPDLSVSTVSSFALACLRLANVVLCSADVAARLVAAGAHATAAAGSKAVVANTVAALEAFAESHLGQAGGASPQEQQQQHELRAALIAAMGLLLELSLAATAALTGGAPAAAPREMGDLKLFNAAWQALARLLTAARAPPPHGLLRDAVRAALRGCALEARRVVREPGGELRTRLAQFWITVAFKLLTAYPAASRAVAWRDLARAVLELHGLAGSCAGALPPASAAAADTVRTKLTPKLEGTLFNVLDSEPATPQELEESLSVLVGLADGSACAPADAAVAAEQPSMEPPLRDEDSSTRLYTGVAAATTLLCRATEMRPATAEAAAAVLLPWALRAVGTCGAASALTDGPWAMARRGALMFLRGCAGAGPGHSAALAAGARALHLLIVGGNPLAARLASSVVSAALQAVSTPASAAAELDAAFDALHDLAAADALAANAFDARGPAWRLVTHIAAAVQAVSCTCHSVQDFSQRRLLTAPAAPPADPPAAAALAAQLHILRLARLPPAAGAPAACCACLKQILAALGQVVPWLQSAQQQQQQHQHQQCHAALLQPVERLLLARHAGWLLEAAAAAAGQLTPQDVAADAELGGLFRAAASQAIAALGVATTGSSGLGPDCKVDAPLAGAAMRVVAVVGSVLPPPALEQLQVLLWRAIHWAQQVLQQLPSGAGSSACHPDAERKLRTASEACELLIDVAGAAQWLGGAPAPPTTHFRTLLSASAWAAREAALGALVTYCRTSAAHGSFLGVLPPECLAPPTGGPPAAAPAFAAALRTHMARAPDGATQRAFEEWHAAGGLGAPAARQALEQLLTRRPAAAAAASHAACKELHQLVGSYVDNQQQQQGSAALAATANGNTTTITSNSSLMPAVAEARAALSAVARALPAAEAAVQRLLAAVRSTGAMRGPGSADERAAAAALAADATSAASRLRTMRDALAALH